MFCRYSIGERRPIETPGLALGWLIGLPYRVGGVFATFCPRYDCTSWSQDARVSSSYRLYLICHRIISLVGPQVETDDESLCVAGRQLDAWCLRYFGPNTEASLRVGWYLRHSGYTYVARLHPPMFWSNSRSSRLAVVRSIDPMS